MLMAYCGKVNKTIVGIFQQAGINAVGLSGIDGRIATGRRKPVLRGFEDGKPKVLRDDHAGDDRTNRHNADQPAARQRLRPGPGSACR